MGSLLPAIRDDLERRDPDVIRQFLPILWLLASFWYRAEVRGLEKIPPDGPVLLVGNHSGGNMTPDTAAFVLAFSAYFGAWLPGRSSAVTCSARSGSCSGESRRHRSPDPDPPGARDGSAPNQ